MTRHVLRRREFLLSTVAASLPLLAHRQWLTSATARESPLPAGLIVRQAEPLNLETPFAELSDVITPTDKFFVRNHFAIPQLAADNWQLDVGGDVKQQLKLSLAELKKLPASTVSATIECAGNGRALLAPPTKGVQWEFGAVGNARWTGVPLTKVLELAGIKDSALEIIFVGADRGEIASEPRPTGDIHFARSLPLSKARQEEVLLAYAMNGEPLTSEHGYPLRLVVPGWYGMASVKWLTEIIVTSKPFQGYWQTFDYSYFRADAGEPVMTPITEMQVKSTIARPTPGELVAGGAQYRVWGAAWAGPSEIVKVEVSNDGGKQWHNAELLGEAVPYSWRLWEYRWNVPQQPGEQKLLVRATDIRGNTQPSKRDPNRRNYLINHVVPRIVKIA